MAFTYTGTRTDLGFGRGWLNAPAARSVARIDRVLGHPMQITEAGRDWAQQNEHFQHYLRYGSPIALSPDAPSIHQKGGALDSNEAQRMIALLEEHGWRRTVYRWVNGKWTLVEPWHFEYFEHLDKHINDPAPAGSEETDVVQDLYTRFGKTGGQKVAAGTKVNLHINDAKDVSVVRDAGQIAGELSFTISGGKPYAGAVQVTPVVRTYKDGREVKRESLRAQETIFTGGDTLGKVSVHCRLKDGQRLSFEVGGSAHDFVVKSAEFRGQRTT